MGGSRLPAARGITPLLLVLFLALAAACRGGEAEEQPTPAPTVAQSAPAETPSPTPEVEPTVVAFEPPLNAADARIRLEPLIAGGRDACPEEVAETWQATCAFGDIDGDGETDIAVLFPLPKANPLPPNPGMVLVGRSSTGTADQFGQDGSVDASILGVSIFDVLDRDGREGLEVSYLRNTCTVSGCTSLVHVQRWDGTAWRDIGPGDDGVLNIETVAIEGQGEDTRIILRGGRSNVPAAGPTRIATHIYALENGRFSRESLELDPPEFLYHAVLEADAAFAAARNATGSWSDAIASYEAIIEDGELRDWKAENGQPAGRAALEGYALFRIAVATAASGEDPTPAIDRTILESAEQVFVTGAEEFRRGYQDGLGVSRACNQATAYFSTIRDGYDTPGYIAQLFDYGYENPRKTYLDLCPL